MSSPSKLGNVLKCYIVVLVRTRVVYCKEGIFAVVTRAARLKTQVPEYRPGDSFLLDRCTLATRKYTILTTTACLQINFTPLAVQSAGYASLELLRPLPRSFFPPRQIYSLHTRTDQCLNDPLKPQTNFPLPTRNLHALP